MNVFNVLLISPRVFSYRCVLPVGFTLQLTYGLKVSGINIFIARYFRGKPLEKWTRVRAVQVSDRALKIHTAPKNLCIFWCKISLSLK